MKIVFFAFAQIDEASLRGKKQEEKSFGTFICSHFFAQSKKKV